MSFLHNQQKCTSFFHVVTDKLCTKTCLNGGKCVFDKDKAVCKCPETADGDSCERKFIRGLLK